MNELKKIIKNRMNQFRSILTGIGVIVFATIFIVLGLFGIYTYSVENLEKKKALYSNSERIGNRISNNLILPVWDFIYNSSVLGEISKKVTSMIIDDEMTDLSITAVIVKGNFGQILNAKVRTESGEIAAFNQAEHLHLINDSFYKKTKLIVSEGVSIGSVEIYFNDSVLKKELFSLLLIVIFQMLILSLITISILYFALKHEIVSPIRILIESIRKAGDGSIDIKAEIHSHNELGVLASAFNDMGERLAKREKDLRESEEKYRTIIESANEAIIIVQNEKLILANRRSSELIGIPSEKMIGRSFTDFIYAEDITLVENYHNKRLAGEITTDTYDFRITGPDGSLRWVFIKAGIINWEGKPATLAMMTDITERKAAEEALVEKTERLDSYFNSSLDLLCIADMSGHFIRLNPEWEKILGYPIDELEGKSFLDLVHPDDLDTTLSAMSTLSGKNEILNFENRYRCKNGSYLWIEWRSKPQGNLIYAAARDITERKNAVENLTEMTTRLQALSDNLPNGMLYQLEIKNDGTRRFTYISAGVENIHGLKPEEVIADPDVLYGQILDEYIAPLAELEDAAIKNFSEFKFEARILSRTGDIKWVYICSAPRSGPDNSILFDGVEIDITESKRAENERQEAMALLHAAIEQSPSGILIADAPNVNIRLANPAALDIRGSSSKLLTGIDVNQHSIRWQTFKLDGTPYPPEKLPLSRAILEGAVTRGEEVIIRNEDGEDRFVHVNAAPVFHDGRITAGIVIFHDITERKKAESDHAKMQEQLSQVQRMESVGRLAGGVAHDFNNMLGVILGHAEMALMEMKTGDKFYPEIIEIEKAAKRSSDLTRQLLAFARKQTISPVVLNLNDIISGMLKMLMRLIGENIELAWMPGHNLNSVRIDPSQIDQIMVNLCVNARDAISGIGKITIETQNKIFDDEFCRHHSDCVPGSFVMLTVSDNGSGMDKDTLSKIFEPFYTTKNIGKGTGLGLAMIYGIVRQNEGFINVYSESGTGTSFSLYFPVYNGKTDDSSDGMITESLKTGNETILLVEDEPMILKLAKSMLEQAGYKVLPASTPAEAVRIMEEHSKDITLLISDVIMPEMNGRDLSNRLLKFNPDLKRIFMSGYTASVIAQQGNINPGEHFLQKPFTMKDLTAKVRKAIDYADQD